MFFQRLSISGTAPALRGGASVVAFFALSLALAPHALAQGTGGTGGSTTSGVGGIRVTLISIGSRQVNSIGQIYLDEQECINNANLKFKIDFAPKSLPSIDIYTGQNCSGTDRRNTTVNSCTYLDTVQTGGVTMGLMVFVKAQKLVTNCTTPQEAKPKLWFLAVSQPESTESVGNNYGLFDRLEIDTNPPSPPVSVTAGEGENVVPVQWTGGQTNLQGFKVYIDPSPGVPIGATSNDAGLTTVTSDEDGGPSPPVIVTNLDAGIVTPVDAGTTTSASDGGVGPVNPACPSLYLRPGTNPADLPDGLRVKNINEPTGTGVDLHPVDIGSKHAAIAVVAVDLAGNESLLSNVACLDVVQTTSFWDRYLENGGSPTSGCACSTVGATQLQSAWPVALALLGLSVSAKRRRKS